MSNETTLVGNILNVILNKNTSILLEKYMSDRITSQSDIKEQSYLLPFIDAFNINFQC